MYYPGKYQVRLTGQKSVGSEQNSYLNVSGELEYLVLQKHNSWEFTSTEISQSQTIKKKENGKQKEFQIKNGEKVTAKKKEAREVF